MKRRRHPTLPLQSRWLETFFQQKFVLIVLILILLYSSCIPESTGFFLLVHRNTIVAHRSQPFLSYYRTRTAPSSSCCSSSTVVTASTSSKTNPHENDNTTTSWQTMTVAQLKDYIQSNKLMNENTKMSKFKRKQDYIDFIQSRSNNMNHNNNMNNNMDEDKNKNHSDTQPQETPSKKISRQQRLFPKKLPPIPTMMKKAQIFQKVYQRYPTAQDAGTEEDRVEDIRTLHHPIFQSTSGSNQHNDNDNSTTTVVSSDMDVIFVGTASCTPSTTRGVSCTALRLNWRRRKHHDPNQPLQPESSSLPFQGGTWLFDVGECTQLQVQRTSSVRPSKITKIFVTHAHGDHSFGLPGLLCLMGQDRDRVNNPPIDIYGPEGLRMWLRVAIRYSVSRIVPPYRVHEIMDVPMAPEWEYNPRNKRYFFRGGVSPESHQKWPNKGLAGEDPTTWISQANMMNLEPSSFYGEVDGGRNIYPVYNHPKSHSGAPVWEVEDEEDVKVYAAPMSHGIPCVGYVVEEQSRPGRLRNELVEPIVKRNIEALKEAGFKIPMKALAVIKNLKPGTSFTFPDGTVVTQQEAVEAPREGRKVVICGDTADSRALINLAQDADLVIHESTNAYLEGIDKDTTAREVTRDAVIHGHSTPQIAGRFAKSVKAKRLVLNHFSARYKGDFCTESLSIMMRIENQAMKASGLNETQVAAAWDLMLLPLPQK